MLQEKDMYELYESTFLKQILRIGTIKVFSAFGAFSADHDRNSLF